MPPIHVAITGATGLIGSALGSRARAGGHRVTELRRSGRDSVLTSASGSWNPDTGELIVPEPLDVLIHLAGRNIATRWTHRVKKELWDSRVTATEKLAQHLAARPTADRPRLLIAASAIGIYGNRGEEVLTEDSELAPPGTSFLSDLTRAWEAATGPAQDAGIRVTRIRIGVVLARRGGALAKLLTPVKLGLGGPIGPGTQFIPWVSLTDLSRLLLHLAQMPDPPAIVNGVVPPPESPVRQHTFIRALGKVLHRPTVFPLPSPVVRLAFGQMGAETLLASLRVVPARLPADFAFEHRTLEQAIRGELSARA